MGLCNMGASPRDGALPVTILQTIRNNSRKRGGTSNARRLRATVWRNFHYMVEKPWRPLLPQIQTKEGPTQVVHGLQAAAVAAMFCRWAGRRGERRTRAMTVPDVNVTAPSATAPQPPYLLDPGKGGSLRNGFHGRYRNEEDKFVQQPCNTTRLASSAGGTCLVGYRLDGGAARYGTNCDMGLDVVMYNTGGLAVEADIVSFDPQKVTAMGAHSKCRIVPYSGYDATDFQDMNQVTRRGSNFHNLVDVSDTDRRVEFYDGNNRPCMAMRRIGPPWQGGNIWVMHVSICRTDAAAVSGQDIAPRIANSLLVRIYDPSGQPPRRAGRGPQPHPDRGPDKTHRPRSRGRR